MKTHTLAVLYITLAALAANAEPDTKAFRAELALIEQSEESIPPQERQAGFARALEAWERLSLEQQASDWPLMSLAYVTQSEYSLQHNDFQSAAKHLRNAGLLQKKFNGRLEYSTKSPGTFFVRLAKLQATITESTGNDPLSGLIQYFFQKEGGYLAARRELDAEVNGITIPGIAENETIAQLLELAIQDGKAIVKKTRWFIGPKASVAKTIDEANREVSFDSNGRLIVIPLAKTNGNDSPLTEQQAAHSPERPKNASDIKSSPPQPAEPVRTKPWVVSAIAVGTAIGLLWLLLKKRK